MSDAASETVAAARISVPSTARAVADPVVGEARRTAPISVLVGVLSGLSNIILPSVFAAISFGDGLTSVLVGLTVAAIIVGISTTFSYIGWKRRTYTIGEQDIRVESGVLSRSARSVPYERIQDVSLEQKLLARIFGLVAVKFETGAGGGEDLSLAYLEEDEGERLRQLVRERRDGQPSETSEASGEDTQVVAEAETETLFTMDTRRLAIFGTFEFSLAVFAVLAGLLQYADNFGYDIYEPDIWRGWFEEQGSLFSSLGPYAQALGAIAGLIGVFVIGSATGLIRTFLREWGFMLERTARGFRRRRGLLTKTDVVMPVHRVQGLRIGTGLLRYRFGWHNLKFVSLAQDAGSSSHVVAPFAQKDEVEPIVAAAGFHLPDAHADWHRASEKYRVDSAIIDSLVFVIAAIAGGVATAIFAPDWSLLAVSALLALAAISAGAALYSWQFKRHAIDAQQIMARSGFLSPQSQIATRLKLHSVEIAQGPIAQRRGYATLHLGLAGGEFEIPGVPIERAREVRREILKTIAATDFSQLEQA